MGIDEALGRLVGALEAHGIGGPTPPQGRADLARLEARIAPLRLPADLRRFWELTDHLTLAVETMPQLHGPSNALWSSERNAAEWPERIPPNLVEIAEDHQQCWSIELEDPGVPGSGGGIFSWAYDDGALDLHCLTFTDLIERLGALIDAGVAIRDEGRRGEPVLSLVDAEFSVESPREMLAPHPLYGANVRFTDARSWPSHWLRAAGLDEESATPRGATMTLAEVDAAVGGQQFTCTVHGTVVSMINVRGSYVVIEDATGQLSVDCPTGTTPFGLQLGRDWEFDLVVGVTTRWSPLPDGEADYNAVAELVESLGSPFEAPRAVATMVRPLA